VAVAGFFYFLPTIVAVRKRKLNVESIIALNLLLGWTLVGWVVALVWATSVDRPALQQAPPPPSDSAGIKSEIVKIESQPHGKLSDAVVTEHELELWLRARGWQRDHKKFGDLNWYSPMYDVEQETVFCQQCGRSVSATSDFCMHCGARVPKKHASTASTALESPKAPRTTKNVPSPSVTFAQVGSGSSPLNVHPLLALVAVIAVSIILLNAFDILPTSGQEETGQVTNVAAVESSLSRPEPAKTDPVETTTVSTPADSPAIQPQSEPSAPETVYVLWGVNGDPVYVASDERTYPQILQYQRDDYIVGGHVPGGGV